MSHPLLLGLHGSLKINSGPREGVLDTLKPGNQTGETFGGTVYLISRYFQCTRVPLKGQSRPL